MSPEARTLREAAEWIAEHAATLSVEDVVRAVEESQRAVPGNLVGFVELLEDLALPRSVVEMLFEHLLSNGIGFVTDVVRSVLNTNGSKSAASRRTEGDPLAAIDRDIEDSAKGSFSTQPPGKGREKGYALWKPQKKTRIVLAAVKAIIAAYHAELPLTARQIFYRLVGAYGYPKTEAAYERLTNYLVRARRARLIDFEDIRDDGASVMQEKHYSGEEAFYSEVRAMGRRYERDKLATQDKDIRVYCEAAGMMPQLRRVTRRYSVPVYSCSGFDSLTAKQELASEVLAAWTYRGRPTVILHLGDHDPSGETIFDAIAADVYAFLEVDAPGFDPREIAIFERVALTEDQIGEYDLPTDPAKESSHSAGWGNRRACQLEALEPNVLAEILTSAIESHMDRQILEADREAEKQERRNIAGALPAPASEATDNADDE
jgi:hypothetical protein